MNTVTIPFNGKSEADINKVDGVITSVSWDSLMPKINEFVRLRPDELIDGLIVSDTDIRVKISRKKGRKKS